MPVKLVDKLLGDPRGIIIVCNVLDGFDERLFNKDIVKSYFEWWADLCQFMHFDSIDSTLAAMVYLSGCEPMPPKFRKGHALPSFSFRCDRKIRASADANQRLAWVIPAWRMQEIFSPKDVAIIRSKQIEFPTGKGGWSDEAVSAMINLPPSELRPDGTLGRGIIWLTKKDVFERRIKELPRDGSYDTEADRARDALGLIHHQPEAVLVALHFPVPAAADDHKVGRPTFMDAGAHRRFRTRAQTVKQRKRTAWGHAVDLKKYSEKRKYFDGLPERISTPILRKQLGDDKKIDIIPLGRITLPRDFHRTDLKAGDKRYANTLRAGRSISVLKTAMLKLIR